MFLLNQNYDYISKFMPNKEMIRLQNRSFSALKFLFYKDAFISIRELQRTLNGFGIKNATTDITNTNNQYHEISVWIRETKFLKFLFKKDDCSNIKSINYLSYPLHDFNHLTFSEQIIEISENFNKEFNSILNDFGLDTIKFELETLVANLRKIDNWKVNESFNIELVDYLMELELLNEIVKTKI